MRTHLSFFIYTKMLLHKLMIAIVTIKCFSEDIIADCSKGKLYCFDGAHKILGNIKVDRCWKWLFLKCFPCSANITSKNDKKFEKYLHHCRYYYGNTEFVFDESLFFKNVLFG